jgi:uncharacterized SAM-binding protein YcdF (DUF218 family)
VLNFSILSLLILSLPIVEYTLAGYWESYIVLNHETVQKLKPQAIVVLGGGIQGPAVEYDGVTVKSGTLVRIRYAAKLAKDMGLQILVSGGKTLKRFNVSEAEVMSDVLQTEFGSVVAWREAESNNTAENARLSYNLLHKIGIERIVLVTEAYHMPRAMSEFRKAGFVVEAAPTAFFQRQGGEIYLGHLIPSVSALDYCFKLSHEIFGMLWYWIRY